MVRVASGPHAGEVVGVSSMADFDEAKESAHIGWTAYDPKVWGTQVNVEAKLLMLGLLFEHGYGRVKLQADSLNARSRAAIEKIGASFEGITRRDQRRADGSWRDAAIFSVLAEEWPEVRAGLERRLEDWGERPVLYRSVPSVWPELGTPAPAARDAPLPTVGGMTWRPDVLRGFEQLPLRLDADDEGAVVATLVRPSAQKTTAWVVTDGFANNVDVLYVHGWSDYFFQEEHALFWTRAGARFHALDLRKYGRSLLPHQTPGYTVDLAVYDADIAAALAAMGREEDTDRPLVLIGHSTGGLTLSLWAARHPGAASALILNSPWLEFQADELGRRAIAPLVSLGARFGPRAALPGIDRGFNTRASSRLFDGEWDYDPTWRPERGFAVHSGWLDAVLDGHARVSAGLGLSLPVLVMLSARSMLQALVVAAHLRLGCGARRRRCRRARHPARFARDHQPDRRRPARRAAVPPLRARGRLRGHGALDAGESSGASGRREPDARGVPRLIVASRPTPRKPAAVNADSRVASLNATRAASAASGDCSSSAGIAEPAESTTRSITCVRVSPVSCSGRCSSSWVASEVNSTVPRIAIPSAEPTCREVDCVPEACPLCATGTSASTTPVSCAVARPTPKP